MEVLFCIIIFLALSAQVSSEPHFTSKPNTLTTAFYGENVNFTWKYSQHPLYGGTFGVYSIIHHTLKTQLMSIDKAKDGTFNIAMFKNEQTEDYQGRLRGIHLVNRTFSFELANIKYEDKTFYALQLEFDDDDGTMIEKYTKLIVKIPSTFETIPGTLSLLRGNTADFPWKYRLNEEDKKHLTTITFGVYRQNNFNVLCLMELETAKTNCSIGKRKSQIAAMNPLQSITFQLDHIDLKDEATYAIRLGGTEKPMENRCSVIVLDPPKLTHEPANLTVKEHEPLSLLCTAYGKPAPTITWYKDDHMMQTNFSGRYFVNNTRKEDAGKYHCVAENKVGHALSRVANVEVQYSPVINTTSKVVVRHAPVGRRVQFKCPTLANPAAKFQWYIHNVLDGNHSGPVLNITIRHKYDYGNYTCRAYNVLGEDQASFMLEEVIVPSVKPQHVILKPLSSTSLQVTWELLRKDLVNGRLIGYRIKYTKQGGTTKTVDVGVVTTWTLTSLETYTWYNVTVAVKNSRFVGLPCQPVTKRTLEDGSVNPKITSMQVIQLEINIALKLQNP